VTLRAKGMSRRAPYLHFRNKDDINKDDIFRPLTNRHFGTSIAEMKRH
jgi:hypothetical protein